MDKKVVDSHLGLFRSLSEQELADAEARASRRFLDAPAQAATVSVEETASGHSVRGWRLGLIGVAAVIVLAIFLRMPASLDAPAMFEDAAGSRKIEFGEVVRSGDVTGSALVLADGSRVEMRSRSELLLERADDGVRIRLRKGSVLVTAVKQHNGHLYVQTKDVTVSVVGTVFLVNAEEEGSRVAVIEGEVRVKQGGTEKKLLPGEQVSTSPRMPAQSVSQEIAWSRQAESHLALLQQSAAARQVSPEERVAFEEASVRLGGPADAGGPRGGGGGGIVQGCSGGSSPDIDPRRFAARLKTLYTVISWAYGAGFGPSGCLNKSVLNLLVGGPEWVRSDLWDIEAILPEGSPNYSPAQLSRGEAVKLQKMLQTLLEDRFKLVVKHETREMPVYALVVRDPSRYAASKDGAQWLTGKPERDWWTQEGSAVGQDSGARTRALWARNATMADLTPLLGRLLGKPMVDRTGLPGEFNFDFWYDTFPDPENPIRDPGRGLSPADSASLVSALQDKLGLKLESTRVPLEVLIIDRVEKPAAN